MSSQWWRIQRIRRHLVLPPQQGMPDTARCRAPPPRGGRRSSGRWARRSRRRRRRCRRQGWCRRQSLERTFHLVLRDPGGRPGTRRLGGRRPLVRALRPPPVFPLRLSRWLGAMSFSRPPPCSPASSAARATFASLGSRAGDLFCAARRGCRRRRVGWLHARQTVDLVGR